MVKKDRTLHRVAATVFGLVALVHAFRLGSQLPVMIGSWEAPIWISWIGLFLAGSLAVLFWQSAKD